MSRRQQAGIAFGALAMACAAQPGPVQAHHNDWAAPLVGGALGGYALSSIVSGVSQSKQSHTSSAPPPPTYYEPVREYEPVTAAPISSTSSVEARLRQLDQLAAGGYITQQEYQSRRTAILNGL
jgi:hypothetical protein